MQAKPRIEASNDAVSLFIDDTLRWTCAIRDIVLIAEYTTDEGPYLDDYFVVFVSIQDGKMWTSQASFYAEGMEEAFVVLR